MKHQGEYASIAPTRRLIAAITAIVMLISGFVLAPSMTATATAGAAGEIAPASAATHAVPLTLGGPVQTADLSQFKPGNIISDAVFFDSSTMTEAQIQAFLQAKVPSCQSGYTCLKDWYDTSRTTTADAMCGAYSGGVRERASTIIYKVAQACGINPQVFVVMLQKEQGLVTSTAPSTSRFTIAMGQGCPDTAACDTRYYGFFNQVYGAAWQLKRYANPPGTSQFFTWYAPGKTWNVRYHPNVSCGSSPVFIQNQATANLYYYTPYQPNAAALAAGYAEADNDCSAYGNRNFYNYFTDWFGAAAVPTIATIDVSTYVMALDSAGVLWGYPFGMKGRWGPRTQLGSLGVDIVRAISVGDLDGDARRDVIGVDAAGAGWLFPGDGLLTFGARRSLALDWSAAALISAAGDFNGDGVPDVFTTASNGDLLLWRGTGAGGLRTPIVVGIGWGGMSLISGGTDMNGDAIADLIARDAAGNLYVYLADGRGKWRSGFRIGTGWTGMTAVFSPGDYSGDGTNDLLARDSAGDLWLYHGTGSGYVAGGARVGTGWQGMTAILGRGAPTAVPSVFPAGAGDVDDDGRRDVLALTQTGQTLAYWGDGAGGWRGSSALQSVVGVGRLISLGDFTGDGVSDLGRIAPDGGFQLLRGRGSSTFDPQVTIGNGWNGMGLVIGGADFDGDRRTDIIARNAQGELYLYRGDGRGGWAGAPSVIGYGWGGFTSVFYAGDFDGDAAPDLIARTVDGSLLLYSMTGTGAFKGSRLIGSGWASFTALLSPGNFDGAGGPDVIARTTDGQLLLYRGDGRGGWTGSSVIGQGWGSLSQVL